MPRPEDGRGLAVDELKPRRVKWPLVTSLNDPYTHSPFKSVFFVLCFIRRSFWEPTPRTPRTLQEHPTPGRVVVPTHPSGH